MGEVLDYLTDFNATRFDGIPFSIYGRSMTTEIDEHGKLRDIYCNYYIDSAVLCAKDNPDDYYTFFIRRVDSAGNLIELD
jgi:hypothetical protein